jgi:hypothetical protein
MSEFTRLAGQQCPPHESLALELAAELGADGVALSAARRTIGVLARSLGASALLLSLPVDESARIAQSAVHQRLLSRLN